MVGNCSGKVVVRSETENAALRVDERNRDATPDRGFHAAARLELSRAGLLGDEES